MSGLRSAIPTTVKALAWVSLFMDLSSELIHSLLPVFMVSGLGAGALTVGLIEGAAEATALLVKIFSGVVSDFFARRKPLILIGYGLAALTKPLFPLASSVDTVFYARLLDRVGKGIRGAPRDALIADVAPADIRGACFGYRQSMDTVGAFLGPLLAIVLLLATGDGMKTVLWAAVLPAAIAVLLIIRGVEEPAVHVSSRDRRKLFDRHALRSFSHRYWSVVGFGAVFTLARFSEAFLVLRADQLGLPMAWIPSVMVVMSLAYALSAYPAGILSDKLNKTALLAVGLVLLLVADVLLAQASSLSVLMLGIVFWGLHMGFSQGILAALVAETTPPAMKGTAFGLFNFVSGIFIFAASALAGTLWQFYGAETTFYCGAGFALSALLVLGMLSIRA
ncbi:MAG: MFS transporter [Gammaproteobacteria bacterium]